MARRPAFTPITFHRVLDTSIFASRVLAIVRLVAAPALFAVLAMPAQAEPHRCTAADGSVSFQDRPCPTGTGHDAPRVAEPPPADLENDAAKAMPASFLKLQQLMIYSIKCPLPRLAGEKIELVRRNEIKTWPTKKKIDEQTAHDVLVASIKKVDKEMAANPATACAHAQSELDDWVRRTPGAQKQLDEVAPLIQP